MAVQLPLLRSTGKQGVQEAPKEGSIALECHPALMGLLLRQEGQCGVYER